MPLSHDAASTWYASVAFPVYGFLTLRALVHWTIWTLVLWRIAALPLRTTPTHPDRAGGLLFLDGATPSFGVVALANGAVFAGVWATNFAHGRARLAGLEQVAALWVAFCLAVAVAPLLPFVPRLLRTREEGLREYGGVGTDYSRQFLRRWRAPRDEDLLAQCDVGAFDGLQQGFEILERMRVLPVERRHLFAIVAFALAPLVPVVLTQVPFTKLLLQGAKALVGAR